MREIKFRAWHKSGEMIFRVKQLFDNGDVYLSNATLNLAEEIELMQYTGLKDKSRKKEIYEGDLIQSDIDEKGAEVYEIVFEDGGFKMKSNKYGIMGECNDFNTMIRTVIGNIYENSELL